MPKTVTTFRRDPWHQQPDEDNGEYRMFEEFSAQGPEERLTMLPTLAAKYNKTPDEIEAISQEKNWVNRAKRHDAYVNSLRKQVAMMARDEAGAKMVGVSKEVLAMALKALQWLDSEQKHPSYREVVEMMRISIELNKNGLALQGVSPGTDLIAGDTGGPGDLIEAAAQVNKIVRRKALLIDETTITIEDKPDDGNPTIIEG